MSDIFQYPYMLYGLHVLFELFALTITVWLSQFIRIAGIGFSMTASPSKSLEAIPLLYQIYLVM